MIENGGAVGVRVSRTLQALGAVVVVSLLTAGVAQASTLNATPTSTVASPSVQTNGRVSAEVSIGGITYLGGDFTTVRPAGAAAGTSETPRQHLAAVDNSTGRLVTGWNPGADQEVKSLALSPDGHTLYVGGLFDVLAGQPRRRIGALRVSDGVATAFQDMFVGEVDTMYATASTVYAGGLVISVNGEKRSNTAALVAATGAPQEGWAPAADDRVRSITASADGRSLFIGGDFNKVGGQKQRHFAKTNLAGGLLPWASHPGYPVWSAVVSGHTVFIGGNGAGGHVGSYTDVGALTWLRQTDGGVQAVAVLDGTVFVGGHFDRMCITPPASSAGPSFSCQQDGPYRHKILAVNASDGSLVAWAPSANSNLGVFSLVATPGWLSVGGDFTRIGRTAPGAMLGAQQGLGRFALTG